MEKKKVNLIKLLSNVSLYTMICLVIITMCSIFGYIKMSATLFTILAILFVLCLSCWMGIPWAGHWQSNRIEKMSIIFLSVLGLCCLLWIVSIILGVNMYSILSGAIENATDISPSDFLGRLGFIRWTCIITIQFLVASAIASLVIQYGKEKIPYQVICIICYAIIDFYFSIIFAFLDITGNGVNVSNGSYILVSNGVLTSLITAVVVLAVTGAFNRSFVKRKLRDMGEKMVKDEDKADKIENSNGVEAKLSKLKALLDSNVITQEEYNQKRQEIIDKL